MVEFFSGPIATKLAAELLEVVAPRLRDKLLGSDEERALGRAFQRAFSAMLEEVAEPISPELADELESQLHSFVADPEVANALLDIAIERREPPVGRLRARFEELGFDPETFLTDFDRAINSFALQLTDELRKEAAKNQSAVFNQMAMAEFDSLHRQSQEVLERLDRNGDDKHLTTFVNTARPMPPNFVPRPEELDELRQTVIGELNTSSVAITGLRGMGGIGKTALAIALCHDGLQEVFPDGIVWVDIGREPRNLASKMRRVGQALGDEPGYYDIPEAGADRLRLLLKDKAVLLVLDDVWDARDIEPFVVDSERCRTLFTTRDVRIALRLNAREVPLDLLGPEQAVVLLRKWAERDDPALSDIAKRLGYLPLALKLAGAQLREGMSGTKWLEVLPSVSDMKRSPFPTDDPQESLQDCFELSVDQLPEKVRSLYYALGIFPEDVRVPQSVVVRLWRELRPELGEFQCYRWVRELARRALIENAADESVTLHDLVRAYTREQLGEDQLVESHKALLSAYNPERKPWSQIEHDGYLYYHLAYHLRAAGRKEQLCELLTGSPDWMKAKSSTLTGDTAYVADLDLAIGDLTNSLTVAETLMLVKLHTARQVVNARVTGYMDADLQTLVWLGRENEALAHARLRYGPKDRFDGLLIIYSALKQKGKFTPSLLDEAQEMIHSIQDDRARVEALAQLAAEMARAGRFNHALSLLGLLTLDEFLHALAEWAPLFEQLERELSIAVLIEGIGIAGWVRPDWRKIHELFDS